MADEPDLEGGPDLEGDIRLEGEQGSYVAVLTMTCPECKKRPDFRAQDETADGHLVCPHCGQVIVLTGDRLTGYQRRLDERNAKIRELEREIDAFNRMLPPGVRRLKVVISRQ